MNNRILLKSRVKAGGVRHNHNQVCRVNPQGTQHGIALKSRVQAGGIRQNHSQVRR